MQSPAVSREIEVQSPAVSHEVTWNTPSPPYKEETLEEWRALRDAQDQAYNESLQADREKVYNKSTVCTIYPDLNYLDSGLN